MKKFISLLISVFALFTSCSGIFEPYGTSLTITLPGAGGRSAVLGWRFEDIQRYEVIVSDYYQIEGGKTHTKSSSNGTVTIDNLAPGKYIVALKTYGTDGVELYTGQGSEDGKPYITLASGQNKTVEITFNKFRKNISDIVIDFDTKEQIDCSTDYAWLLESELLYLKDENPADDYWYCESMSGFHAPTKDYDNSEAFLNYIKSEISTKTLDVPGGEQVSPKVCCATPNEYCKTGEGILQTMRWDTSEYFVEVYKFTKTGEEDVYIYSNVITIKGNYTGAEPSVALWSGKNFYALEDVSPIPSSPLLTEAVDDFFFDKNENLVVTYQKGEKTYIKRYNKNNSVFDTTGTVIVEDNSGLPALQLAYDRDNDVLYVGIAFDYNYNIFQIENFTTVNSYTIPVNGIFYFNTNKDIKDFAVSGDDFYLIGKGTSGYYDTIYHTTVSDMTDVNSKTSFDSGVNYNLTDVEVRGDNVYILLAERESSYMKGGLVFVDKSFNNTGTTYFISEDKINSEADNFYGPQKFISRDFNELVIADEGFDGINQVNRIVRVDISGTAPQPTKDPVAVDVEFDYTISKNDSGAYTFTRVTE